ncbi:MAG TPA: CBS domain-containing protein [Anaerolineales bacterium]|nr:CBS domain-containing protein [Anaerolineales bacterium]
MKLRTILATKGAEVVTIQANQTLKEAVTLLAQRKIGVLIVVDAAGALVGILSERDVIREAARHDDVLARPVSEAMTKSVITGTPQDDVSSVMQTMTDRRFRHLPILDGGRLAGIISIGDLVKAQLDEYEGEIDSLQFQITKG